MLSTSALRSRCLPSAQLFSPTDWSSVDGGEAAPRRATPGNPAPKPPPRPALTSSSPERARKQPTDQPRDVSRRTNTRPAPAALHWGGGCREAGAGAPTTHAITETALGLGSALHPSPPILAPSSPAPPTAPGARTLCHPKNHQFRAPSIFSVTLSPNPTYTPFPPPRWTPARAQTGKTAPL